jgi:hypothetical protein
MTDPSSITTLLEDSGLGEEAEESLRLTADDLGPSIAEGLGDVSLDDVQSTEVVLVLIDVDDSSSIAMAGNTDIIRQGHNDVLRDLKDSKSAADILVSCITLNGDVIYPFVPLDQAKDLDNSNYNPDRGTPLYDSTAAALATVVAKAKEFEEGGFSVRTVTYVVTDGADQHSRTHRAPESVAPIVEAMLRTESHIIGGIGIDDEYTDFREVFRKMGFPEQWILTPDNDPSEIRRAFGTASKSAVQASQTAGGFSTTAMGGFGN